jgi:cytochrome oxidase assembly protein ShyY1
MIGAAAPRRASLVVPSVVALSVLIALIGLGLWQLERKAWKEALIDTLDRRLAADPVALPPREWWTQLDRANDEFRRVRLRAEFLPASEGRVYTGGSGLREDIKGPGYFAFAPTRLADGSVVVVNRGFVPNPRPDAQLAPIGLARGPLEIVGVMRWSEPPGWFVSAYSAGEDLWFVRDHITMAARYGWGEVAPFYIDQEAPVPAGGMPRPAPLKVSLRNEHLQYAFTWFGLATVLVVAFAFWARSARRTEGTEFN